MAHDATNDDQIVQDTRTKPPRSHPQARPRDNAPPPQHAKGIHTPQSLSKAPPRVARAAKHPSPKPKWYSHAKKARKKQMLGPESKPEPDPDTQERAACAEPVLTPINSSQMRAKQTTRPPSTYAGDLPPVQKATHTQKQTPPPKSAIVLQK